MNMLAPDVVTLGNHEVDYGIAHLLFIEKCAQFPIINANLYLTTNHVRLFRSYLIVNIDGMKVLFIGILTEDVLSATKQDTLIGCDRFEKKLHDLELTRTISIQMAPQIRLIQNNNALMSEKIQSTINNTIPLWKNQMVLALGLAHTKQAMEAQREVTDLTNELLKKNADALKTGTVEVARESERGIVDMETLRYTNEQLITTLDEVLRIQDEGRQKRREAETELGRIEGELKQKLLELRS